MNQRTWDLLLLTAAILVGTAALSSAQESPKPDGDKGTEKRYSICLWPNPCGATGKPRPAPAEPKKEEKPKPSAVPHPGIGSLHLYVNPDPLSQTILRGRVEKADDGVVSAVRLKDDQILYKGDGSDLRDSLASGSGSLRLPASSLATGKSAKNAGPEDEWVKVDKGGVAAGQVNGMRSERAALAGGAAQSREGLSRMWGDKRSASEARP
ncbi:MAG: hypothetical protein A2X36_13370 [Elusimicrobia bacterium GWA2_69_24]|nr:MAG: hypothetical protein A2X36_13370 [Elusimicrobia bacterium GWA2_69_24]HBL15748.1 hypothetical protein [Elusimicrobiota bacterium]